MDALLNVAFPVFAIVLAGYGGARFGLLGEAAAAALNRFVYYFALPSLLFVFTARAPVATVLNWPFIFTIIGSTAATAVVAVLVKRLFLRRETATETTMFGLAAIFANTGYMGVPLFATAFGPEGTLPAIVATMLGTIISLGGAMGALDATAAPDGSFVSTVGRIAGGLVRNPLIVAPVLGLLVSLAGWPLPAPIGNFLDLLAAAAGPAALFALGLSLHGRPLDGDMAEIAWATVLKLVVHPAAAWLLAVHVFALEPFWANAAVLLMALPTGALVFVVAQQYGVYVRRASTTIVVATAGSVVTVSVLLIWLGVG